MNIVKALQVRSLCHTGLVTLGPLQWCARLAGWRQFITIRQSGPSHPSGNGPVCVLHTALNHTQDEHARVAHRQRLMALAGDDSPEARRSRRRTFSPWSKKEIADFSQVLSCHSRVCAGGCVTERLS
jgi:hypothetical protein